MGSEQLKSWMLCSVAPIRTWELCDRDIHHPVGALTKEQCPPSPLLHSHRVYLQCGLKGQQHFRCSSCGDAEDNSVL